MDPGSGAFLTPGSGMGKKSGSGSGMNNPDHIYHILEVVPVPESLSLKKIMFKKVSSFSRKEAKFFSTTVLE